jgi:hypothetical protein
MLFVSDCFFLQCIITMPDGVVNNSDVVQIMNQGNDLGVAITNGNTVIFDSYTPEHEVRRRNINRNNISKLNHMQSRFSTKFDVHIQAESVTAVLCAETVSDYKVVDKRSSQVITASDKRPDSMKAPHEVDAKHKIPVLSQEIKSLLTETEEKEANESRKANSKRKNPPDVVTGGGGVSKKITHQTYSKLQPQLPNTPPMPTRNLDSVVKQPPSSYMYHHTATYGMISHQPFVQGAFGHPGAPFYRFYQRFYQRI